MFKHTFRGKRATHPDAFGPDPWRDSNVVAFDLDIVFGHDRHVHHVEVLRDDDVGHTVLGGLLQLGTCGHFANSLVGFA
jgi:hypothetical protein